MKPSISTTALVVTLVGTGLIVFNVMGLSISVGDFTDLRVLNGVQTINTRGITSHTWYLDLWTVPQRVWMTIGALLIVCGRMFDARFPRA